MRTIRRIDIPKLRAIAPKSCLRVAAYCRVSTDQDEQLGSYRFQQEHYAKSIADHAGWISAGIYADRATGRNIRHRARFIDLMADCRAGQIDLIVTKSISRFGRNTVDVLKACQELKALGVDVHFEIENLWLSSQHSDVLLTILAACHQNESEDISGNIRWGILRSFESGNSNYHNRICYGYRKGKDGHLVILNDEATIVREIFALYLNGHSIRQVIGELESSGTPSPRGHPKWGVECASKFLSNEKYTGDILLGKTFVKNFFDGRQVRNSGMRTRYLAQDCHPAIVPKDLFERVQEEKRRRKANRVE